MTQATKAQPETKANSKLQVKAKPETELKLKSRAVGTHENLPNRTSQNNNVNNPNKFLPNDKPGMKKNDSESNSNSFLRSKTRGQQCSSNIECLSTNCVFKGQQSGKGSNPNPDPKPKPPNKYGSRSLKSSANKADNRTKAAVSIPVFGTCQNEIEQDPVPKGKLGYFHKLP